MNPKPFISQGNRKMSFPTFSLPAKQTCPGCTALCSAKCYATKAERAYPQVLPSRKRNLEASKSAQFVAEITEQIASKMPKFFRIHESGDFYSQAYLNKWIAIAETFPGVKFLAFTKSFHLDYSQTPSNLVIIWSIWTDPYLAKVPPGPRAYAGDYKRRRKTIECPGSCDSCGMCWDIHNVNADVHFDVH